MRITRSWKYKSIALIAGAAFAGSASSATLTLADLGLSPEQIRAITAQANAPATSPGIAFGSPTGFGAGWGVIGFGVSGQTLPDNAQDDVDGSATVSFGLGDPVKWVGLQADVNIISLRKSFGDSGNLNLKLHTTLPGRSAVSVGVEGVGAWGDAKSRENSVYAAFTKVFSLNPANPTNTLPLAINIGLGDERFESNRNDGVGLFGGFAFIPHPQFSIIADWTGQKLNAGVSVVPFRRVPLSLTVGALDVTERDINNVPGSTEFSATLGYAVRF